MLAAKQVGNIIDKLAGFRFVNVRKFFTCDLTGLAAVPAVRFAGVRVSTERDQLLAIGEQFDLLSSIAVARG